MPEAASDSSAGCLCIIVMCDLWQNELVTTQAKGILLAADDKPKLAPDSNGDCTDSGT